MAEKMKIVTSEVGEMGSVGWEKWRSNALKFLSVPAIMYVTFVLGNVQVDGITIEDFIPNEIVIGGVIAYIGNAILDFLRKFTVSQDYIVEK